MEESDLQLLRGDAVARLQQLDDASVDSFITDPPYGQDLRLGTRRQGRRSIQGDGRRSAVGLWRRWLPEAARVARPDTMHGIFGTWRCPWHATLLARHFRIIGCVVWDKRCIGLGHYLRGRYEQLYIVAKGRPPKPEKAPADIWDVCRLRRTIHPTQKPIELMRRVVEFTSRPGQLVCDPFAGIASTGVACHQLRRRFIGVELDPEFHSIGRRRLFEGESCDARDSC